MQQLIEYEGKTIDDAIKNACEALSVPREKLNIEIISEGTSGFLGLRAKKAKIKAGLLTVDTALTGRYDSISETEEESLTLPLKEKSSLKLSENGRGLEIHYEEGQDNDILTEITPASSNETIPQGSYVTSEMGNQAKEFLEGVLARMSIPSMVTMEETPDKIILRIQGDGGGLLIGKRGKNLDALQYIVNKAINLSSKMKKMVTIDTEAYQERRENSLVALAQKLAEKAKSIQKPITLNHMNAHNRRIIHLTLEGDPGVTTKSRGEGEFRKIVIIPVKEGHQPRYNDEIK